MFQPYPLFIGFRYTRSRRSNRFISFVSAIALLGMVLSVMVLIIVLSVMNGFEAELRDRILAVVPHAVVESRDGPISQWQLLAEQLQEHPQVVSVAPYIGGGAMLSKPGIMRGVQLGGVLPSREMTVTDIEQHMIAGSLEDLRSGQFGIVLGGLIARHMALNIGDRVTLVLPMVSVTPAGIFPRLKQLTVVGVFSVGAQLDSSTALIHLDDAQRLYRLDGGVNGIRLKLQDLYQSPEVVNELQKTLAEDYIVKDWSQSQGSLFDAVKMEKNMMTLLLMFVVAVAAFNIVSILTMMVTEKRGDIAVLRTLGSSPNELLAVFLFQGVTIGVAGILLGTLLGVSIAPKIGELVAWLENLSGLQVFNPDVYFISHIPSILEWGDVLTVTVGGLIMSILATLYPAYRAAQIQPAEALQYE